jgi:hypothetical protein
VVNICRPFLIPILTRRSIYAFVITFTVTVDYFPTQHSMNGLSKEDVVFSLRYKLIFKCISSVIWLAH